MKRWHCQILAAAVLMMGGRLNAETIIVEHNTFDLLESATRDRFIAVDREPLGIRLARSYLVTNESGASAKSFERFGQLDRAKVQLEVPIPGFTSGLLLLYISYNSPIYQSDPFKCIGVNGRQRPYVHDEARMLTGGWARHDIPAEELKAGVNEIVIGGGGGAYVDTLSHAGRSFRSFDEGKTWKPDALGPDGQWSGEYIVRLRVFGHPPAGEVTSSVIDLATQPNDPRIRPKAAVRTLKLKAEQDTPEGTQILYAIRSGSTPTVTGRTWGNWQPIEQGAVVSLPGDRYVQWRATLKTRSSDRTPAIRSVHLELEADVVRPDVKDLRVDTYENPAMVQGSYSFTWESDTPRIRHLREKYKLPEVVREAGDELGRQTVLRRWVSERWDNGWDRGKYRYVPPWDALELLELAPAYLSMGMCTHYSCTYVQTAAAIGFDARSLIVDHHCLTEIWSNQLGKWMLQDPGPGPGPKGYSVGYAYQAGGQWLNALEMHKALRDKRPVTAIPYKDIKEPWTLDSHDMGLFVRFGIPLRNNHLSVPAPAEVEHGAEQYHWDGYLWWTDSVDDPKYPEYSQLSNRVGDFYGPLNQVAVDLQRQNPDALIVNLATQTPNFLRYEAVIDGQGEKWQPVESGFRWGLHEGGNRFKVRTVNTFDIQGPETVIAITRQTGGK